jgi:uncharacterized protein YcnI
MHMKKMMKKLSKVILPAIMGLFLFSSVASAHVTVIPKTSATGAWETYMVKVPVEKEVPTTKITLKNTCRGRNGVLSTSPRLEIFS